MLRTNVRRVLFKLAVLIVMIGALFFYRSDTRAQFGSAGCDNDFEWCISICADDGGTWEECVYGTCAAGYMACWQTGNPPIGQPQMPCPPCVAECDFNQLACLAEGSLSSQTCAFMAYRCKQRCNYGCFY